MFCQLYDELARHAYDILNQGGSGYCTVLFAQRDAGARHLGSRKTISVSRSENNTDNGEGVTKLGQPSGTCMRGSVVVWNTTCSLGALRLKPESRHLSPEV